MMCGKDQVATFAALSDIRSKAAEVAGAPFLNAFQFCLSSRNRNLARDDPLGWECSG
jgi:hypothetical protein